MVMRFSRLAGLLLCISLISSSCKQNSPGPSSGILSTNDAVLPGKDRQPLPQGWTKDENGQFIITFSDSASASSEPVMVDFGSQIPGAKLNQIFVLKNQSSSAVGTGIIKGAGTSDTIYTCPCVEGAAIPDGYLLPNECLRVVLEIESTTLGEKYANIFVEGMLDFSASAVIVKDPSFQTFNPSPAKIEPFSVPPGGCKAL